jgi:hypothetical protein
MRRHLPEVNSEVTCRVKTEGRKGDIYIQDMGRTGNKV